MSSRIPLTQALVNARWAEIGAPLPAPLLPASHEGSYMAASKAGFRWTDAFGKMLKPSKADAKKFHDFWSFFTKVAIDPYRKQSGISKVAGAVLQVASVALPAFGIAQAASDAGNAGLAIEKQNSGTDEKLAIRVMTPAVDAFIANEEKIANEANARKNAETAAQILALTKTAPATSLPLTPISFSSPSSSTAQIQMPAAATLPAAKKYYGMSEIEIAALAAGLLGVLFLSRRYA